MRHFVLVSIPVINTSVTFDAYRIPVSSATRERVHQELVEAASFPPRFINVEHVDGQHFLLVREHIVGLTAE